MIKTPRGIRNNNPLNIESGARWVGLMPRDAMTEEQAKEGRFCVFVSPEYGLRAGARILHTYQKKHHLTTVAAMIRRWAPPTENDAAAYSDAVARSMGVPPTAPFVFRGELAAKMLEAMTKHENGIQPYPPSLFREAVALANLS